MFSISGYQITKTINAVDEIVIWDPNIKRYDVDMSGHDYMNEKTQINHWVNQLNDMLHVWENNFEMLDELISDDKTLLIRGKVVIAVCSLGIPIDNKNLDAFYYNYRKAAINEDKGSTMYWKNQVLPLVYKIHAFCDDYAKLERFYSFPTN